MTTHPSTSDDTTVALATLRVMVLALHAQMKRNWDTKPYHDPEPVPSPMELVGMLFEEVAE